METDAKVLLERQTEQQAHYSSRLTKFQHGVGQADNEPAFIVLHRKLQLDASSAGVHAGCILELSCTSDAQQIKAPTPAQTELQPMQVDKAWQLL